jgi:hypothetical protein
MTINTDVCGLLSHAGKVSSYKGEMFTFKGDLCQMSAAASVASQLGLKLHYKDVYPFVTSKEDFDKVVQHLISNKIDGWHHYVTYEKFCEINGEYYFNRECLHRGEEIHKIANELGIYVGETPMHVLYATSKENYEIIMAKLIK